MRPSHSNPLNWICAKVDWRMKKKQRAATKSAKLPAFVVRAERAAGRAAKKLRAQNRALGLPFIVWRNGKVVEIPA